MLVQVRPLYEMVGQFVSGYACLDMVMSG